MNGESTINNIKQQELLANSLVKEISQKISGQKRGQEIKIYEGEKAYRELVLRNWEQMKIKSETFTISGIGGKYNEIMNVSGVLKKIEKIEIKKNIKSKYLFS